MTTSALRRKVFEEITQIPDERLPEVYDVIHFFRVGLEMVNEGKRSEDAIQHILTATDAIYGLWEDRSFDVEQYIRDLRKDRCYDHA